MNTVIELLAVLTRLVSVAICVISEICGYSNSCSSCQEFTLSVVEWVVEIIDKNSLTHFNKNDNRCFQAKNQWYQKNRKNQNKAILKWNIAIMGICSYLSRRVFEQERNQNDTKTIPTPIQFQKIITDFSPFLRSRPLSAVFAKNTASNCTRTAPNCTKNAPFRRKVPKNGQKTAPNCTKSICKNC